MAATLAGVLIGEYRITERLGAGGMGEVWKAVHSRDGRTIAVKILYPDLADGSALRRFYSEASIQASLHHPGLAEYLGFYEYQGRPCILMEFIDGETLQAAVRRRGALPPDEAVAVLQQIAAAVGHFHAQGVVHRDLKAANIKISSSGAVKILDFGIALHQRSDRLTSVGMVVGTLESLAPEQVLGEAIVPATDVWQLGVMFYEMLTGQSPFRASTTQEIYARIVSAECPPATRFQPTLPPEVERVLRQCLQKDPARRIASGSELHAALQGLQRPAIAPATAAKQGAALWAGVAVVGTLVVITATVLIVRQANFSPGAAPAPPAVVQPEPATGPDAESPVITIDTVDGVAQVFENGKQVGTTPYRVRARTGEQVNLLLRREGFADMPVQFEAREPHIYTYTLEPAR